MLRTPAQHDDDNNTESYSSDSESYSESYSNDSDIANWEEYVNDDGSLFYVEYLNKKQHLSHGGGGGGGGAAAAEKRIDFARNSSLRAAGKKPNRRQQQQQQQASKTNSKPLEKPEDHLKFDQIVNSEECAKMLELVITAGDRYRFGRRSTAVESILGFRVVPFVDQPECLMVESFVHDMPELMQQNGNGAAAGADHEHLKDFVPIQRGDWFKSLDGIEIRTSNVDDLLLQFIEPTNVCLKFQGRLQPNSNTDASDANSNSATEIKKIENFSKFSEQFEKLQLDGVATSAAATANSLAIKYQMPFGLLILPPECYQSDEHKNSLYYYPEDMLSNFLYKARGSFLTLNAVLTEELKTKPNATKLTYENIKYFVFYRNINGFLVCISYPCDMLEMEEGAMRADELMTYLGFVYPNLGLNDFQAPHFKKQMFGFCEIQRVRLIYAQIREPHCCFEEVFRESRYLPLPKEAQLRIFDALSEMEAMDYRNWNSEPLHTHREFFIYGSVLYYDHFMLVSQIPLEMRHLIETFMRCRGIFDFISDHHSKELYIWKEITLPNAAGRYFLCVCGRGHLTLAVVLKMFEAPDIELESKIIPSLFYIEEIQETLDHLVQCGIESLAMFWSVSNKRPEALDNTFYLDPEGKRTDAAAPLERDKEKKLESFIKQKISSASSTLTRDVAAPSQRSISHEDDTQLCASLGGGSSVHSLTPSEDDSSRRRLLSSSNANNNNHNDDSDSCGSDWEHFNEQNILHYGGYIDSELQSQVTESLWKEIKNVVPVKISAGWKNQIFYYVYVDSTNNSVFCPLKSSQDTFPFLKEMRKAFYILHRTLRATKKIRLSELARASSCTTLGSSHNAAEAAAAAAGDGSYGREGPLVPIKEHGMTVCIKNVPRPGSGAANADITDDGSQSSEFVCVGRLFLSPPKEVYICHRAEVPQNMVELAFRLSFFSSG